jgi:hypothetical protein
MGILPGWASSEMDAKDSRVRIGEPIGGVSRESLSWDSGEQAPDTRPGGDPGAALRVAVQRPPAVAVLGPELNHADGRDKCTERSDH